MKKHASLILVLFIAAALVGCSMGNKPAVYSPNPNNVNFNDNNLTTNFVQVNPNDAGPYGASGWTAAQ